MNWFPVEISAVNQMERPQLRLAVRDNRPTHGQTFSSVDIYEEIRRPPFSIVIKQQQKILSMQLASKFQRAFSIIVDTPNVWKVFINFRRC